MISDKAIIAPSAVIHPEVEIGPFSVIGANVEIGAGTIIHSHVVIKGPTTLGKNNKVYQFASIGEDCQDKKYAGEATRLEIGDDNVFREGATVHRGTVQGGGLTCIGDSNLFMVNTHVAHDCEIGNHVIFSNGASIAGHVTIGDYASLGGMVGVHQFCSIGAHSYSGGGTIIAKDVLPFVTVSGFPAKTYGLNTIGLERRNFSNEVINTLRKAYKIIFRESSTIDECQQRLAPFVEKCQEAAMMSRFIFDSQRGIVR